LNHARPVVLSIAGSDPSGGAGIQADLKTFAALGVDGCAVPVALTAQSARGVRAIHHVPPDFVAQQIEAVFSGARVSAVKIGMLGTADVVHAVADAMRRHRPPFIVLDPVIQSTSGAILLDACGVDVLRNELLPLVDLVTPNAFETGALIEGEAPVTVADARVAGERLVTLGAKNVLITGGHLMEQSDVVDVLVGTHGTRELRVPRVSGSHTRGTGCRLSSAVAAFVGLGRALPEACAQAQRFVGGTIVNAL
jgi:hydroxymethylpyrimidine kinase/phosphomethylpyrimidine kinase